MLEAKTIIGEIGKIIFKDVEGLTDLERLVFGKKYLACQLGSRVGMLKIVMPDFGFQEVSKISKKFPKSTEFEVCRLHRVPKAL